jgi:hypothetical protein
MAALDAEPEPGAIVPPSQNLQKRETPFRRIRKGVIFSEMCPFG